MSSIISSLYHLEICFQVKTRVLQCDINNIEKGMCGDGQRSHFEYITNILTNHGADPYNLTEKK